MATVGDNRGRAADARSTATDVVRRLHDAGHVAYFAGGCVRDRLLGFEPTDYDVATDARPEVVAELFRSARYVGESFGVTLVRRRGRLIQVATFRTEGVYSDGRHPDTIAYSDARHDAERRDFTINGLFEDPLAGRIIDYVGGRADLEAKLIRAIGEPAARLREDPLRTLRAVRFAARFGFAIEPETAEAVGAAGGDLRGVSRERIGEELKRMLSHPGRAVAAWELQYLGLDAVVLAEDHRIPAPRRLGRLPDDVAYPTALAAWLLDRHGEGASAAETACRWAEALLLSTAERRRLARCLEIHATLRGPWPSLGVAAQKRLAAAEDFRQALLLLQAADRQAFVEVRRRVEALSATGSGLAPEPMISGEDLIELGLSPGPAFKRILDAVYDAQLEGGLAGRVEALDLARALAREGGDDRS